MSYYDHATAMAFKLDRWSEERPLRHYELEALRCNRPEVDTPFLERASLLSFKAALRRKVVAMTKTFSAPHNIGAGTSSKSGDNLSQRKKFSSKDLP